MKDLILKFGLGSLEVLCKEKGWKIPSSSDLEGYDSHHEYVWVSDPMDDPGEDMPENYGMVYSFKEDRIYKCNKNFKQNVVVIKGTS